MKIVVNGRFLLPDKMEGIGYYSEAIIKELSEEYQHIEFYVLTDRKVNKDFGFGTNVHFEHLPPPARHPVLFYLWFQWSVKKFLKHISADLFISFDGFCVLSAPCPTLLVIHDLAYRHYPQHLDRIMLAYYRYFTPRFVEEADHIITVSDFSKSEIARFFPKSQSKISVSCNAVRNVFLSPNITGGKHQGDKKYFVTLGAIQPRKNLIRVIKAFHKYHQENQDSTVVLKIIGRKGWKYRDIEKYVEEHNIEEYVVFTGYLDEFTLVREIIGAIAMVYVSLYEGFGVPILEAMALGTPVISSDRASMPEVAGGAAIEVDPDDVAAIAEAMRRLSQDSSLRMRLAELGKYNVRRYSWKQAAKPFLDYINRMNG